MGVETNSDEDEKKGTPELLPVRMLNEFVYCPRLFYLEYIQGEFEESADTLDGQFRHKRVDTESGSMPAPQEEKREEFHARSLMLSGEACQLIAKMDLVEGEGMQATPVDYKKGSKPDIPEEAWLPDRVQICAQGLILRENGYGCDSGVVYYSQSKSRVEVKLTDELIKTTLEFAMNARAVSESGVSPPPLLDSPKCPRCSLVGICLPDETNMLNESEEPDRVRMIVPLLDNALPLYVQEQGAVIGKSGEELIIRSKKEVIAHARMIEISQVGTYGNVQITAQALHELCDRNIPICYFSYGGWFYGVTHGLSHKNVELRIKQFAVAADKEKSLMLARAFVNGKIRNCRTMLRRNGNDTNQNALEELEKSAKASLNAASHEELLGIEGNAARIYFLHFKDLLKKDAPEFRFEERNRRPPKDPVNALLSYVYSIMAKDFTVTLTATGFDPYLGFYHAPRYGKPSLALDAMEEFRPIIADSVVITLINNGEVTPNDFITRAGAVATKPETRKKILEAYERRMDATITHPIFGYTISYRRVMQVQARLLARYVSGELDAYPVFCTR